MNKLKEKAYQFRLELFRYIKRNPHHDGMELLEQFEKIFLTEDLIFCSKQELKNKLNVVVYQNEDHMIFETGIRCRKHIPLYELENANVTTDDIKKLIKEEFVDCLEIDWLDKHFI